LEKKINVLLITQARLGSSRFPNKILQLIGKNSILSLHLNRLKMATLVDKIIVATTFEKGVNEIISIARCCNVDFFQGSTDDVLNRFYKAAKKIKPNYVVRVTSDCPLIDPKLVDEVIEFTRKNELDYGSNTLIQNYPDGQDVEVFKYKALERSFYEAKLNSEREHVTPFIIKNSSFNNKKLFKSKAFKSDINLNFVRMTVDEEEDYKAILTLVSCLGTEATWQDYADYYIKNSQLFNNNNIIRNEGFLKSLKKDLIDEK
jgi:spore coat polysaccharide biosynthesis protein SpsF